jgi:hypothetical protein
MRFHRLTVPLLVVGLTACNSGPGGSIAVSWSFAGSTCRNAGVEQVRIAIAGESLSPDTFDCASGVASFDNFFNGTYAVVVQGLNAVTGEALWSGSTTATVMDGDTAVSVTLQPLTPDNAVAYLSWTFDAATGQVPQCGAGQRLDSVGVFIDGQDSNLVYHCADGVNPRLAVTPYLAPGDHQIQLVAFNAAENVTAFAETDPVTLHFATSQAPTQSLTFHWNVGGLRLTWAPYASVADYQANHPVPCGSSGITEVEVFLVDPNDANSSTGFPGFSCGSGATLDNAFPNPNPPGTWLPFVSAFGGSTLLYFQDQLQFPQQVTLTQGRFFDPTDPSTQAFVPIFP